MGKKLFIFGASAVLWIGVLWQALLKDVIFMTFSYGKILEPLSNYPYNCKRLYSPLLESCEDIKLDEEGRHLYAACSSQKNRLAWSPAGDLFDLSARELKDHISVLNIDDPGEDGMYGLHTLEITGDYKSSSGGKEIDLFGFEIEHLSPTRLRFWLINNRPPIDSDGNHLDATKVGANSTIEVFEHTIGSKTLEFVKTVFSDRIITPNGLAADGQGGVFVTNDHDYKVGFMRLFRAITFFGKGSVAHCTLSTGRCSILSWPGDFNFANGITKPTIPRNIIYVAHTSTGLLTYHIFYNASSSGSPPILSKGIPIKVGMPIDNLCSDSNGDVYFAGLPDIPGLMSGMEGEYPDIASSILKVSMENTTDGRIQLVVSKVMEDRDGKTLPAASGVCHDVKRNSFWMGSVVAPFITVCEDANPRIFKHIVDETIIVDESQTVDEATQERETPRDEVFSSLYAGPHH